MQKERAGELFILGEALLWGLFPVITVISLTSLPTITALAFSEGFAALFFATLLTARKRWKEIASGAALFDILAATVLIGIVYYALMFTGLAFTSAGNAGMLALSEIFFAYLFFNVWRKEHFPLTHVAGALLMLLGAGIVLYPNSGGFAIGDFLIIAAAAVAPFGNFFSRRAREKVSSETIMFVRSALSAVCMFALAAILAKPLLIGSSSMLLVLIGNGVFLLGLSKIFWIEGIHRISVTKANALGSAAPLITLIFAFLLLGTPPSWFQLAAFFPMFFGVLLLSRRFGAA